MVFPRFDESWQAAFGKTLNHELRIVDPFFGEDAYEQMWQAAVDYRDEIKLLVLYSWNEHEEHPTRGFRL